VWQEFGPDYFELAQLTHISADTYRALAPSIQDGALAHKRRDHRVKSRKLAQDRGRHHRGAARAACREGRAQETAAEKPLRQLEALALENGLR
jgi:hypothetical protein